MVFRGFYRFGVRGLLRQRQLRHLRQHSRYHQQYLNEPVATVAIVAVATCRSDGFGESASGPSFVSHFDCGTEVRDQCSYHNAETAVSKSNAAATVATLATDSSRPAPNCSKCSNCSGPIRNANLRAGGREFDPTMATCFRHLCKQPSNKFDLFSPSCLAIGSTGKMTLDSARRRWTLAQLPERALECG